MLPVHIYMRMKQIHQHYCFIMITDKNGMTEKQILLLR